MEVLKDDFSNLEIGTSVESFQKFLVSQNDLFRSQLDHLQRIVVTQCKLTGVNPLSQEMAAGALSITIGKRPRDLLNPKAVKYMQTLFSIKDALSKKESREISALFGVKVTQVREFFNSQRSRVRKLVRVSREKAIQSNSCKQLEVGGIATNNDPSMPIDAVPLNSDAVVPLNSDAPIPLNSEAPVPLNFDAPVPLNTIEPSNVDNGPSCSTQDGELSGIDLDGIDKHFVQTIFSMMQKEETFSGQVKLMEWILQIQNSSVLCWFLTKGGAIILATWLSQAAAEEQTSLLHVILEVFCHLPLHKALSVHISAILQSVNNLRFYRTSDISNRARFLVSRWSKLLTRSQALKKPNGMKLLTSSQTDLILKQSIGDIMYDESWKSNIDIPENFVTTNINVDNMRKLEFHQALKLLPASDDLNRKNALGLSSSRFRERRKVQMVEQPEQKIAGRNSQAPRTSPASQGRPMSTDDIQKAKMRAQFMQNKYGKSGSSNGRTNVKSENVNKPLHLVSGTSSPASKIPLHPKFEDKKKTVMLSQRISNKVDTPLHSKIEVNFKDSLGDKCKRVQIQWRMPPEIKLNDLWRVGDGENSKEAKFQKNRNSREKETFYQTILEIPSNPKEPWDVEMDYDDSLTPEILTEQMPDNESSETEVRNHVVDIAVPSEVIPSQDVKPNAAEPDLELLAVLLKNPELVYALTSGQVDNFPAEETVKLLDMIKASGACNMSGVNRMEKSVEEVEVSLPSPTPSSNAGTSGWKPAVFKNPFSQRDSIAESRVVALASPPVDTSSIAVSRNPANHITPTQHLAAMPPVSHRLPASVSQFSRSQPTINGLQPHYVVHSHQHQHQHQQGVVNSPNVQLSNSEIALALRSFPTSNLPLVDGGSVVKPVSFASNTPERIPMSFQSPPSPTPTRMPPIQQQRQQQPQLQPFRSEHPHQTRVNISLPPAEKSAPSLGSWRPRQQQQQDIGPHYNNSGANQNNDSTFVGGRGSMAGRGGPSWGRNEFESWSPEKSPERAQDYSSRPEKGFSEPRINSGRSYGPADQQRQRSPYGYREQNRHGNNNRRWRDRQY